VTLPADIGANQGSQQGRSGRDHQVTYPAADMDSGRPALAPDTDEDVIVLDPEEDVEEVIETVPADDLAVPTGAVAAGDQADDGRTAAVEPAELAAGHEQLGATEQWHDIQALFVDDPRASVQMALQAVDDAMTTFAEGLRERQAALAPDARPDDTERLRATLRSSRAFWENLVRLGDQLRSPDRQR
jgi:hypothetical protein